MNEKKETAYFAAGCFWGVEAEFQKIDGVIDAIVGCMGGHTENPTYEQVCSDRTGHAEAVQVIYDPKKVSYEKLLDVFWRIHNPTTKNRQGPDIGTQYRSVIFTTTPHQEAAARKSKDEQEKSGKWDKSIVTEIMAAPAFYRAEDYHQRYYEKHGLVACRV